MLINAVRWGTRDRQFDDFAFVIVTARDKYEQELLATHLKAEDALDAKNQAEQALQAIDRREDEFLATLAHELRSPLAPIQAMALTPDVSPARLNGRANRQDPRTHAGRRLVVTLLRLRHPISAQVPVRDNGVRRAGPTCCHRPHRPVR
jgi:signal transduction histidine kinase